jgi:sialate O-acetylesterase
LKYNIGRLFGAKTFIILYDVDFAIIRFCRSTMNDFFFKTGRCLSLFFLCHLAFTSVIAQVRLPRLISDGMVLQRDASVSVWGWAAADEQIEIEFVNRTYRTTTDENGRWKVKLANLKAGGPFTMNIKASNNIVIKDILVGDVWLCSGQSNMELWMKRVSWIYPDEIATANYPLIRQFYVPRRWNFNNPQHDLSSGSWIAASPATVPDFSAVGFFFAKEIHNKYNVPVGIINSALGGSAAEAWISEDAIKKFPEYTGDLNKLKDSVQSKQIDDLNNKARREWMQELSDKDKGHADPANNWYQRALDTHDWDQMAVPGFWSDTKLGKLNGAVWFRKTVQLPESIAGKKAKLILGCIVDSDSAFVNGQFVGTTGYQYPPRRYNIPEGLLMAGENTIAVKVISSLGNGGFVKGKNYQIKAEDTVIDLKGAWRYRLGAEMQPLRVISYTNYQPVGLYNAMIAPLVNYSIKGVVWYQGETNADRPSDYGQLMSTLIHDWRTRWQKEIPFIYVQLPNFGEPQTKPSKSNWALLREQQLSLLSLPATAMVVTIDVGEWNDLHPLRKKDVGSRAALAARRIVYHEKKIVHSGPVYQSMTIEDNKIILSFSNTGSGLVARGGKLGNFAIAGSDHQFVWAEAKIFGQQVIVSSDQIDKPVAVRYAWADNPEGANLYNKEGLPASPFRTDRIHR